MVKQNYLDIYPSYGIAEQLNAQNFQEESALKILVTDVQDFIKNIEQENVGFLQSRKEEPITSADTLRFFRSQERTRNSRLTLQYLVAFLDKLPLKEDIIEKLVNPFEQFKSFTLFGVELLKEPDVNTAILREHERLGLLNETNTWYYRGQINKNYKQVLDVVFTAKTISIEGYCKLFEALQRLCLFWFSVRSENIKRVRKADIFIYKLSYVLLHRHGCVNLQP